MSIGGLKCGLRNAALILSAFVVLAIALIIILDKKTAGNSSPGALPASFDWRAFHGGDYTTPAVYQGRSSACGPFAEIGVVESLYKIRHGDPHTSIDLSEQYLLSCMADYDGANPPDTRKIDEAWKTTGIVDEGCFPYVPTDEIKKVPCAPCTDWSSRVAAKVTGKIPIASDAGSLKTALIERGPIVVGMDIYEDFATYKGGLYHHKTGRLMGGHVVMLVGYNDADGCWIIKNTGPQGWGENGFMRLAYGESGFGKNAYALEAEFLR